MLAIGAVRSAQQRAAPYREARIGVFAADPARAAGNAIEIRMGSILQRRLQRRQLNPSAWREAVCKHG